MGTKLQPFKIAYNLGMSGAEQKTDEKFVATRPVELANVRFPKTGMLGKRPGMVPAAADDTNTFSTPSILKRLIGIGEQLLAVGTGGNSIRHWFTRASPSDDDQSLGSADIVALDTTPPVPLAWVERVGVSETVSDNIDTVDCAIGASQTIFIGSTTSVASDAFISIRDNVTGKLLYTINIASPGSSGDVRALAIPGTNSFLVAVASGASIYIYHISENGFTASSQTITRTSSGPWDWALFGSTLFVAYHTSAATTITPAKYAVTASSLGAATTGSTIAIGTNPLKIGVCVPYTSTENAVILVSEGTNGLRGVTVNTSTLAVVQALWVIDADTTTRNHICGATTSSLIYVFAELNHATDYRASVVRYAGILAGGAGSPSSIRGLRLCSKPITTTASPYPFIVLGHASKAGGGEGLQHARFLYENGVVIGSLLRGNVVSPPSVRSIVALPQIAASNADPNLNAVVEYACADILIADTAVDEAGSRQLKSIGMIRFNVHPSSGYQAIEDEGSILVQGGFLALYDGMTAAENGFLLYPEIVSVVASNGAGSLPVNGTFNFVAVFFYIDALGRVHRSAPSEVVTGTTGATDDTFTVLVRGLVPTQKGIYGIELYRTPDDEETFYLAEAQLELVPNAADTVSFTVTGTDATLLASTPLGQQAGILDSEQPNCPTGISTNGQYILAVAGDDRFAVIQGKERRKNEGASFLGAVGGGGVTKRITQDGEILALAICGERRVALKGSRIFLAAGGGSDDSNQSDTLSDFEAHPMKGVGVADVKSIVETSFGLVFRSKRGYYLLEPGGGLNYLGSGVDNYKDFPVRSAVFHADVGEAHFLLQDGPKLVLSMHETLGNVDWRWSIDELNDSAIAYADIAVAGGRLWAAGEDRDGGSPAYSLFVEDPTVYGDQTAGYPVVIRIETGWIPITGEQQGRGRLYSAKFLGNVKGIHTARVRAAFNYVDTWIDDKTITSERATRGGTAYQWEYRPSKQKIESVKLEFTEVLESASQGLELNQILLDCGVQAGSFRLRTNKRAA